MPTNNQIRARNALDTKMDAVWSEKRNGGGTISQRQYNILSAHLSDGVITRREANQSRNIVNELRDSGQYNAANIVERFANAEEALTMVGGLTNGNRNVDVQADPDDYEGSNDGGWRSSDRGWRYDEPRLTPHEEQVLRRDRNREVERDIRRENRDGRSDRRTSNVLIGVAAIAALAAAIKAADEQ